MEKATAIDQPEARPRFRFGYPIRNKRLTQKIGNSDARRPSSEHHNVLISKLTARHANGGEDGSDGDCRSALNVVVKGDELVAVAIQDGPCVILREIFPLQQGIRQFLFHGLDETIDKFVVGVARNSLVTPAQIFRVAEPVLVIRADIQNYR